MNRFGLCGVRFLFVFFSVVASLHSTEKESLNAITRFPYQDSTRSNSEAFPIVLSGQTVMFVWASSTGIQQSTSTDGGVTWNGPTTIALTAGEATRLTGIRTLAGRLIVFWRDSLAIRYTFSDDGGVSWTAPLSLSAGPTSLVISQTSDGKLWLGSRYTIGIGSNAGTFKISTDNGATWGSAQMLPTPRKDDICFASGSGGSVVCIYATAGGDIERIISTDGGVTWSAAVPILNTGVSEKRPRVATQSNGTIWLLYDFTQVDSVPTSYQRSDIKYVTSPDGGTTWSSPVAFTRYVGNDNMHNLSMMNDEPFVSFASTRWQKAAEPSARTQLWYGIIGETPDDNPPPILLSGSQFHNYSDLENWIRASVDDEAGIATVTATYFVDSIGYPSVQLVDDGLHCDGRPGDNTWGNSVTSFPNALIECRFAIGDIGGNTLNDVYGFSFVTYSPPATTHVIQGSSMQVLFNGMATFGKYVLPNATYPGYGVRYPNNVPFEHVYGAGIWVGGKIDTTAGGTGERIKAVSTGYEGYLEPLNEFFPRSLADSIWRVYGRNAIKPAGWDQYWGSALQFRPFGDENFYNQYDDYTHPVTPRSMGLNVIQSSYTWNDPQGDGIQILRFKIMNNSVRTIDSAYVGFFMDADVGPIDQTGYKDRNCSGFFPNSHLAYTYNPIDYGSTPVGVSVLDAERQLDSLRFAFQWYPMQQSPTTDALRFDLMSSGVIKPDEYPSLSDTRFLLSFGPFTIRPYTSPTPDTLRVAFALLSGTDLNQLQAHADNALAMYQVISGVKQISSSVPEEFELLQNYPNPFNPVTHFEYAVPNRQLTVLKVYDVLGREVTTLVNEVKQPGMYTVQWDGSGLASGVYIYRLTAGSYTSTKKALLLK
jgi:hypothetical protein